jgi:hypothetical protein
MQLSDMRTVLLEYLDDPSGDLWTNARLNAHLNMAKDWIVTIIEKQDKDYFVTSEDKSITAVSDASDATFALDATYRQTILVERLNSGNRPTVLQPVQFRYRDRIGSQRVGIDTSGPFWCVVGSNMRIINPVESFTLRHWYLPRLADMSADADTPSIPKEWHNLLVMKAATRLLRSKQRDMELIRDWEADVQVELQLLINSLEQQKMEPRRIRETGEWE